jgi:hypothetical protein
MFLEVSKVVIIEAKKLESGLAAASGERREGVMFF